MPSGWGPRASPSDPPSVKIALPSMSYLAVMLNLVRVLFTGHVPRLPTGSRAYLLRTLRVWQMRPSFRWAKFYMGTSRHGVCNVKSYHDAFAKRESVKCEAYYVFLMFALLLS